MRLFSLFWKNYPVVWPKTPCYTSCIYLVDWPRVLCLNFKAWYVIISEGFGAVVVGIWTGHFVALTSLFQGRVAHQNSPLTGLS